WRLAGVVYLGSGHFTSRYIDSDGRVWSHDGISQSNFSVYSGMEHDIDLGISNGRKACCALYVS
ncbi:hypothetical protein BC629DRAFT_1257237, partial [Irpex lacteus]